MTNAEVNNQAFMANTIDNLTYSSPKIFSALKIIEYLLIATFICVCLLAIILPDNQLLFICASVSISSFIFVFLLDRQFFGKSSQAFNKLDTGKKAQLYTCLLDSNNSVENSSINLARENALQYCQELIDDYKNTRGNSRNIYYIFQMTTVIFSGITPILVLVDKLESGQAWLKWLPVICPAIASIVASIVTSFPFEKNWLAANTAVELLESEQEKFILGVTPAYRCYDLADDAQRQQMAKMAIENFLNQVNSIHLNLVQKTTEKVKEEKTEQTES